MEAVSTTQETKTGTTEMEWEYLLQIADKLFTSTIDFFPYSDRLALLKLSAKPFNLNVIQTYVPTAESTEQEIETFYKELKELIKLTKKHEIKIIMGDFNSKIGKGRSEDLVGPFGLGARNERGNRLLQLCQDKNMKLVNTWFGLPPRRLYTWKSPADKPNNIVRNQIEFRTFITRACTYLACLASGLY